MGENLFPPLAFFSPGKARAEELKRRRLRRGFLLRLKSLHEVAREAKAQGVENIPEDEWLAALESDDAA